MSNKSKRLAYSKYYPQKQAVIPERTKQEIVLGVNLEDVEWNGKKRSSARIAYEEMSVGKNGELNFRSEFINEGERVCSAIVGDKLLLKKDENGYLVSETRADSKLFRISTTPTKELCPFMSKKYPLHKYNDTIFFITKSEGR